MLFLFPQKKVVMTNEEVILVVFCGYHSDISYEELFVEGGK